MADAFGDRPLRILTAADLAANPNSGSAGTVHYTNLALRKLGHSVDELWAHDLPRRRIAHGNLHALLEQPRALRVGVIERCARQDYDVVQISQPPGYSAALALRARGFRGLTVNRSHGVELRVDQVMDVWHRRLQVPISRLPWVTGVLNRLLARQWHGVRRAFDGVAVGCVLDQNYLVEASGFASERVRAIAHGVEPGFLDTPLVEREGWGGARLLHVGQYAFIKGTKLLPQIVNRVLGAHPEATFTWVCSAGSHSKILAAIDGSLHPRVNLLDGMPIEQLRKVFDAHDLFVFPSLYEGFGKAAVEAMARGLCVVASDEGGMRDCIRHGETGWLCAVGDISGFSSRLLSSMAAVDESRAIGRAASRAAQAWSWEACALEYVAYYRFLAARRDQVERSH